MHHPDISLGIATRAAALSPTATSPSQRIKRLFVVAMISKLMPDNNSESIHYLVCSMKDFYFVECGSRLSSKIFNDRRLCDKLLIQ